MSYRSDDVQQILQKALAKKQEGEFSREQLSEMASELGISPEMLQSAEQEWQAQQSKDKQRQTFNRFRRQAFKAHLIAYLAVNVFLIAINLLTSPRYFWAIYPILGWGLGLFFHGWATFQSGGNSYDQAFQQWKSFRHK
jgi:hypothetical protein